MAKCMCCGEDITHDVVTNLDDFISHEACFQDAMNNKYGEGNWRYVDDDENGGFYMAKDEDTGEEFRTGVFYTEIEGPEDTFLFGFEQGGVAL